jgi:hypothetical protein
MRVYVASKSKHWPFWTALRVAGVPRGELAGRRVQSHGCGADRRRMVSTLGAVLPGSGSR